MEKNKETDGLKAIWTSDLWAQLAESWVHEPRGHWFESRLVRIPF